MYGKFFASTFTGSMVGSGPLLFAVWGYVIANTQSDGTVEINPRLLASVIGQTTADEITNAVNTLCLPDANSRSKEAEGRRLVREGQFLYRVVNFGHYRAIRDEDSRKTYMREYMRDYRARKSAPENAPVNSGKHELANTEAEAEVDQATSLREVAAPANAGDDGGFSEEELQAHLRESQTVEPARVLLTSEDERASDKGFPWPQVHAIFKRIVPELGMHENAPARDSAMKVWWRRNGKSVGMFEHLASKVQASDFLMARNGHAGRNGRPYPWSWIFSKYDDGVTRAVKVMEDFYSNERMAFVLEKASKAKLTKVMVSSSIDPVEVDLSEQWNDAPRYRVVGTHANGCPEVVDIKD